MKTIFKWLIVIILIYVFLKLNNEYIVTTDYTLHSDRIPESFNGYRIVQVSDLHDGLFGENNKRLIAKVSAENPDAIFITGDVIDSRRYNLQQSLQTVEQLVAIAPTYYVTGNHEIATNELDIIYEQLENLGVVTLKNEALQLTRGNETISIAGIEDPLMDYDVEQALKQITTTIGDDYLLLLSHRTELFPLYVNTNVDAVFTGHAHGGQIRIPFLLEGMFAPGQGWMPKYTGGVFKENDTQMFVSRGLGNSTFQQRIFNFPEITSITLVTDK